MGGFGGEFPSLYSELHLVELFPVVILMLGGEPPMPLPPNLEAFKRLITFCGKRKGGSTQKFVKKVDIPSVELPVDKSCHSALNLVERGLIGQFTSLWPSPKAIDGWVQRNWRPLISDGI